MPGEKCFCQSNRPDHIEDIYDLFLWEVEEGYLTLVRTPAGHEMPPLAARSLLLREPRAY